MDSISELRRKHPLLFVVVLLAIGWMIVDVVCAVEHVLESARSERAHIDPEVLESLSRSVESAGRFIDRQYTNDSLDLLLSFDSMATIEPAETARDRIALGFEIAGKESTAELCAILFSARLEGGANELLTGFAYTLGGLEPAEAIDAAISKSERDIEVMAARKSVPWSAERDTIVTPIGPVSRTQVILFDTEGEAPLYRFGAFHFVRNGYLVEVVGGGIEWGPEASERLVRSMRPM